MRRPKVLLLLVIIVLSSAFVAYQLAKMGRSGRAGTAEPVVISMPGGGTETVTAAAAIAVAETPESNPQIAAAQAEARAHWAEFAEAWNARTEAQSFFIKYCFADDGRTECLWVAVDSIDAGTVRGRLDNDPRIVQNITRGDEVSCPVDKINDWQLTDGVTTKGGFTTRAQP